MSDSGLSPYPEITSSRGHFRIPDPPNYFGISLVIFLSSLPMGNEMFLKLSLEYSCFTALHSFLLYSNMNQLYVYLSPLF